MIAMFPAIVGLVLKLASGPTEHASSQDMLQRVTEESVCLYRTVNPFSEVLWYQLMMNA